MHIELVRYVHCAMYACCKVVLTCVLIVLMKTLEETENLSWAELLQVDIDTYNVIFAVDLL